MLTIKHGDVFQELKQGDVFVHGCNSKGVMGSGIAKVIKDEYPSVYLAYKNCPNGNKLGSFTSKSINGIRFVNAVTQVDYGRDNTKVYVNYLTVEDVMKRIVKAAEQEDYKRIVFPFIGGGLANGNREILLDIFHKVFDNSDIEGVLVIN